MTPRSAAHLGLSGPQNVGDQPVWNGSGYDFLRDVFNVKNSKYGAKGDVVSTTGVGTDDTEAIQAAIDDCGAAGGGTVYVPPGIYRTTAPLLITSDRVHFRGAGRGIPTNPTGSSMGPTVFWPTSSTDFSDSAVIVAKQSGTPTRSLKAVVISDFAIWGGALATGVNGVHALINSGAIRRLWLSNIPGYELSFDGVSLDGWNNDIELNLLQNAGTGGMTFTADAPDNRISRNTILSPSGDGIKSVAPGLSIQNNFLLDCDGKAINSTIYKTKAVANRIEDCNGGIYLSGTAGFGGFTVTSNELWNCSRDTDNTTDSVNVTATKTTRGGIIACNEFYTNVGLSNGGTSSAHNRARYHVNIASSNVTGVVLGPNSYEGYDHASASYGTSAYSDSGTSTRNIDALA